ncbi:MAG: SdiA-regulated domain-containing protein [Fibrobacteria bacterium]
MAVIGRYPGILCFLALAAAARTANGQSLASSLGQYRAVTRVTSVAGVSAKSFSGAAFHPVTHTLYVVDNDNNSVYELDTSGVLLRTIATTGFADLEGIAYQADDWFLVSEEGLANVVRVKLPRTGTGPVAKPSTGNLKLDSNMANSGIEGVAYRASDKSAFAVKEINPPRIYRITLDGSGNPAASQADTPFDIGNKSGDAADIYALNDGNFILVNQEGNKLEGYGPQGQALSSLSLGMSKPEGLAIDTASGTLYVVGEPVEFRALKKPSTAARHPAADGYAVFLAHAVSGSFRELRFTLPVRSAVRIEFATVSGRSPAGESRAGHWTRILQAEMNPGSHAVALPMPEVGVGFYRFSAGNFRRVLKQVSAP